MLQKQVPLLEVKGLKKHYPIYGGIIPHAIGKIYAVDGVDFEIPEGTTLGLVGESGCGKSTVGRQIVGLERPTEGKVIYRGRGLDELSAAEMKKIRTQIQMIFQDPFASLNPRKRIVDIISEPMRYHKLAAKKPVHQEVDRLLELVGLPRSSKEKYPHEFSGGQKQRIGIARALSLQPKLIVCDEPVSALDVSIQAQVLNLLRSLQKDLGLTYLFIGHGLDAVNYISSRIAVMYLGRIVEIADAKELFSNPVHPYTQALCNAAPIPDPKERERERVIIQGEIPSNTAPPVGCPFHPRCPHAIQKCREIRPVLEPVVSEGYHMAACRLVKDGAEGNK